MTDEELVSQTLSGNHSAFVELVKRHDHIARTIAYAVTMDRHLMDDVMQEAYLKAFRSLRRFEGKSYFRAWLCRIVKNTAIDQMRSNKRVVAMETKTFDTPTNDAFDAEVSERQRLVHALSQLTEQQRIVLRLIDVEGVPYAEAADFLKVPVGTVASRVSSARSALRSILNINQETE